MTARGGIRRTSVDRTTRLFLEAASDEIEARELLVRATFEKRFAKVWLGTLAACAFSFTFPYPIARAAGDTDNTSVSIDQILSAVQTALSDTQAVLYSNKMPPLKNVTLELQAQFTEIGDAGFNLYIISADGKVTSENTQKLVLSLAPPSPEQTAPAASPKVLGQYLKDSLIQAARGVQAAAVRKPPLQVRELKAEIEFVVQKEGTSQIGFKFRIVPVDVKIGAALSTGAIQRISVDFGY
jgi:hypothetical protein